MANPILTGADSFEFVTSSGVVLELFGTLESWQTEAKPSLAEHKILKRAGALHQQTGTEPRRWSYSCAILGADVTAKLRRIVATVEGDPFGRLVDPRLGAVSAVCEGIVASESPGDALDSINFTIKFAEDGLRDTPRPTPSARAQQARSLGAQVAAESAAGGAAVSQAGATVSQRATGFMFAISQAEAEAGTILDVDASLAALSTSRLSLDALGAPQSARDAAARTLAAALQARNSFLEGRPALVLRRVDQATSLSALAQSLYGGRALDAEAEIRRLNRIPRPWSIPAGTELLLSDPAANPKVQ